MSPRTWLLLAVLAACHKNDDRASDDDTDALGHTDGDTDLEVVVGHTGPKAGAGALAGGPAKGAGTVTFPGSGTMPVTVTATPTVRDPGVIAPQPPTRKADPTPVVTGTHYYRFFLTVDAADHLGLSEMTTLDGVLATPPFPVGTLLVVPRSSGTPIGVASFVDGRTARAAREDDTQDHGEIEVSAITLPVSSPQPPDELALYTYPKDGVPFDEPLTLANLPALLAGATLVDTVEYKP